LDYIYPERNSIGEFRYSIIQVHSLDRSSWPMDFSLVNKQERNSRAIHPLLPLSYGNLTLYLHATLEQAKLDSVLATDSAETFVIHGPSDLCQSF